MPSYLIARIIAMLATGLLIVSLHNHVQWLTLLIFIITVGHYAQALFFSRKQIGGVVRNRNLWLPASALSALGPILYVVNFPIIVFFGIHHVLNEVYVLHRQLFGDWSKEKRRLRTASIVLGLLIYFAALRHDPAMTFLYFDLKLSIGVLAVAYLYWMVTLWQMRHDLSKRDLLQLCTGELGCLPLLGLSAFLELHLVHVIFYHVVLWTQYPFLNAKRNEIGKTISTALTLAVIFAFFFIFAPFSPSPIKLSHAQWLQAFLALGYVHISVSFALSTAHPAFIRNLCASRISSRPAVPPAVTSEAADASPIRELTKV